MLDFSRSDLDKGTVVWESNYIVEGSSAVLCNPYGVLKELVNRYYRFYMQLGYRLNSLAKG